MKISLKIFIILFLTILMLQVEALTQEEQIKKAEELLKMTIRIKKDINNLRGKLKKTRSSARQRKIEMLIDSQQMRLKKTEEELKELLKPKIIYEPQVLPSPEASTVVTEEIITLGEFETASSEGRTVSLGTQANIYLLPTYDKPILSYGLYANYNLNKALAFSAGINRIEYETSGSYYSQTPLTLDLLAHPILDLDYFQPYFGAGLGYYITTYDDIRFDSYGMQIVSGFTLSFINFDLNLSAIYQVPDINYPNYTIFSYSLSLAGILKEFKL